MIDHCQPRLRIAILGLGFQGREHLRIIRSGAVPGAEITALIGGTSAPRDEDTAGIPYYASLRACIAAGAADAVVVASPHLHHRSAAEEAMHAGLHVLIEKPVAVCADDVQSIEQARRALGPHAPVVATVYNLRTDPRFIRLRELIRAGSLGRIHRVTWTVTDWFRTEAYYRSSPWRGTWRGEGGGVLANQAVHQLDVWCWMFGLPQRVQAWCRYGAWHDIEVEDDVTCFMAMHDGATGVFITSTGDSPGTNRLELDCEQGRLVIEGDHLIWDRPQVDLAAYRKKHVGKWEHPPTERIVETFGDRGAQLAGVLADFTAACIDRRQPMACISDALAQVELANAMLVSAVERRDVSVPLPAGAFAEVLQTLQNTADQRYCLVS